MRLHRRIAQFTKSLAFLREAAIVLSGARFASFRVPTIKLASSSEARSVSDELVLIWCVLTRVRRSAFDIGIVQFNLDQIHFSRQGVDHEPRATR